MRLKECLYFVYMDIITKFKYYCVSLFSLVISILVINTGLGTYFSEFYVYNILENSFDTNEVYKIEFPYITMNEEYAEDITEFISISNDTGLSMYTYTGITFEEQNAGYTYDEKEYDSTHILSIDNTMLANSKLVDENGDKIYLDTIDDYYEVAVGYNLKEDFPVGTILTDPRSGRKYTVAYVLKNDTTWITTDSLTDVEAELNIDDYIISPIDEYYYSDDFTAIGVFSYTNSMYLFGDEDISARIEQLYDNAENCGISIDVKTLEEIVNEDKQTYNELYVLIFILCISLGCASAVMIIMLSVLDCASDKYSIGIYMANGMLSKDIYKVILIKNMSRIILPFVICTCIIFIGDMTTIDLHSQLLVEGIVLIAVICCELLATHITYGIIKRTPVLKMIRGED